MSETSSGLGRNAAVMAAGTAVSRVLGVVRASVLVGAIGLNAAVADAFETANWLPNMLYMLIAGGVLNAVLVPQVVRAYRSADGQSYVDRLLTLSVVLLLGLTALLTLCAPLIIRVAISAEVPEFAGLATVFAFWCIPQVFFYGLYTLLGQVLNARGNFGPYMWAPVLNNVVAIASLVTFIALFGRHITGGAADDLGVWDGPRIAVLAGGATLGVIAQALVLLVPLYRSGFRYRPRWDWRGTGLGTAGRVAGWAFGALAVGQVGVLVVVRVANDAAQAGFEADIAGYNAYTKAFLIFMLPHSLVTVSLLTALFTRLSDHAAARDTAAVRSDFSYGLRTVSVFTMFAAVALSVLALPIARTIFPSAQAAEIATLPPIIVGFMVGLVALGAWSLCQRVFYAYEDAKGLFWIQVAMAGFVITGTFGGRLLLEPERWVANAALAIAASYVLGALWGGTQVWRRLGGGASRIIRLHVRAGLAALLAGGAGWAVSRVFGDLVGAGLLKSLAACVVVGAVLLGAYVGLLRVLKVAELDALLRPLIARLRRTMGTPAPAQEPVPSEREPAEPEPAPEPEPEPQGGDRLDGVVGRGTLLAGRYRLHQPAPTDLPGVDCWSARDQILDKPVRALVLRAGRIAQAQDGARRAALVSDPRLLRVLDVGDHEGVVYVVTEPLVGTSLAQLTEHGPLQADQARAIVAEAAAALEVARRRGVHHLALRPSALHVTPDGGVVVSGLALDGEPLGHDLTGAKATSRADTVGLVCLLYLALTGRWPARDTLVPFEEAVLAPVVEGVPVAPAELAPGIPNDLDTLCAVTLGPHDDGPHSPAELVRELEPWGPIHTGAVFGPLDPATTATIPSGPWDAGADSAPADDSGKEAPSGAVEPGTEATAGAAAAGGKAGEVATGKAAKGKAGGGKGKAAAVEDDAEATAVVPPESPEAAPHPVPRRPVRRGEPWTSRPGVPPPAEPPIFRADPVPAARPSGGATALLPASDRGDQEDFDSLLRSPEPLVKRRFNPTPFVLGIMGILVVVGMVMAWNALTRPAPPIGGESGLDLDDYPDLEEEPDAPGPEAGNGDPTAPPVIASAQMLDPPPGGDDNEHPEAVHLAIDGDPATFWFSRSYASPTYGMKPGIGYAVTLAEPAAVSTVTLRVNGSGGVVEVRLVDPAAPADGEPLASGPLSPETVLTFPPTVGQHVVLWFPALPQTPDGSNRIELYEVAVS